MKKNYLLLFVSLSAFFMLQSGFAQSPVINELYSRGTAVELDWIEIYNPTASSIDITGYKIYDSGGNAGTKPKKLFPGGSVIPANGVLVIITDDTDPSGFGLSSSGEKVWFEDASGTLIDSVDLVAITDTATSYGRMPDGSANWQILNPRTRGTLNSPVVVSVVINELFSRGTAAELDWIEIYNPSASSVDITGFKIYDSGGNAGTKPKKEFPVGSVIPATGFLVIIVDDTAASGFGLSSSGEKVWFENASGTVIDSVDLVAITDTAASYGRFPDGSASWNILIPRTRGVANILTSVEDDFNTISEYQLYQNYPNPFNPTTTINFTIPATSNVSLKVFNILGKEVATLVNETKSAGNYSINFDASGLSSGVYFYQLTTDNFTSMKKFTLMK
jgi:predicted extracellular nuclease